MSTAKAPTKAELEARVSELEAALEAKEAENIQLAATLEQALGNLEHAKKSPAKETIIDTKEGKLAFIGKGVNMDGTIYTAQELKLNPEVALKLYKGGSELLKKV